MGQKVSVSQSEQNELYNLFGVNPSQKPKISPADPKATKPMLMRMMAPTALAPQQRSRQPKPSVKKQRPVQPAGNVRRESARQVR